MLLRRNLSWGNPGVLPRLCPTLGFLSHGIWARCFRKPHTHALIILGAQSGWLYPEPGSALDRPQKLGPVPSFPGPPFRPEHPGSPVPEPFPLLGSSENTPTHGWCWESELLQLEGGSAPLHLGLIRYTGQALSLTKHQQFWPVSTELDPAMFSRGP